MNLNYIIKAFALILLFQISHTSDQWPNHDISTLKMLQIVHRHGERTAKDFPPNDPFDDNKYWSDGMGDLTAAGKYRLYKLGQFIRQEYADYLGDKYSPREVYARSAYADRCIESLAALMAGAYPPRAKNQQWNQGNDAAIGLVWQPIAINTVLDKKDDLVLDSKTKCKAVDKEFEKIHDRDLIKEFLKDNHDLYKKVSKITGQDITDDIEAAADMYKLLEIEISNNMFWNTSDWSVEMEKQMVNQLQLTQEMQMKHDWDSRVIKRLRAGGLVNELTDNFKKVLKGKREDMKLYAYSTHHEQVGGLMHALDVYNDRSPPYGAALMFELHQYKNKGDNYFVRLFYHNETVVNTGTPYAIPLTNCRGLYDCPFDEFVDSTKDLIYDDFEKECKD